MIADTLLIQHSDARASIPVTYVTRITKHEPPPIPITEPEFESEGPSFQPQHHWTTEICSD
jgi:hypothetical protein